MLISTKLKSILVSQPKPPKESSSYKVLEEKYGIKVYFEKFFDIATVETKEFAEQKINLEDYSSIIFTSKSAIDAYFKVAEQVRYKVPDQTKYFCLSEALAYYLQKYVVFKKRKVYFGEKTIENLSSQLLKFKTESFLLPSSATVLKADIIEHLEQLGLVFKRGAFFKNVNKKLSFLKKKDYNMIVLFSPSDVHSLFKSFPVFEQNKTIIATFGTPTLQAAEEKGLVVQIKAPTPDAPSMSKAIEKYLTSL